MVSLEAFQPDRRPRRHQIEVTKQNQEQLLPKKWQNSNVVLNSKFTVNSLLSVILLLMF
jgi:hypothetical protein